MTSPPLSARLSRRVSRAASADGVRAGLPPSEAAAILGANLVREFDARYLSAAGVWTDRVLGMRVTSPGNPTQYAADGAFFGGRPVHQASVSSAAALAVQSPSPPIWTTGTRPYALGVAKFRPPYPASFNILMKVANAPTSANTLILITGSGTQLNASCEGGTATASFTDTAAPHVFEAYVDAAGVVHLDIDGAAVASGGSGISMLTDSGHLSFGGNQLATANLTDSDHAHWLFCQQVPTGPQRTQLLALMRSIWALP